MNTKSGVTLLELIVVVIVVGILATLAIANFIKAMETTKAEEAVVSLKQIRHGEIVYRGEENTYWPEGSTETNVATINSQLRLSLDTRELNWDYFVTAGSNPPGNTFTATAKRKTGRNKDEIITIDQNGSVDETNWSP